MNLYLEACHEDIWGGLKLKLHEKYGGEWSSRLGRFNLGKLLDRSLVHRAGVGMALKRDVTASPGNRTPSVQ